jgi:carbonic anhydrase
MCNCCLRSATALSRRRLLGAGMAALTAAALPIPAAFARNAASAAPQNAIAPDAALQRLMQGNARYAANTPANRDFSAGRAARAQSQHPIAAILSCADSRVAPELAFDQGPGDLFVVRVAGNFVNDDGLASIEYAVKFLGVPLIMVLGHSGCGAVGAAIKVRKEGARLPGHLQQMIRDIKPAVAAAAKRKPADLLAAAIEENVRSGTRRLAAAKPILAPLVAEGKVKVVGAQYDLASGRIALL